jgi:hypothetical protein
MHACAFVFLSSLLNFASSQSYPYFSRIISSCIPVLVCVSAYLFATMAACGPLLAPSPVCAFIKNLFSLVSVLALRGSDT